MYIRAVLMLESVIFKNQEVKSLSSKKKKKNKPFSFLSILQPL